MSKKPENKETRIGEIRILFPKEMQYLFNRIKQNAKNNFRSHQAEILSFLEKNYK